MKLKYVLEIEVPDETRAWDYQAFLRSLRHILRWNEDLGWKTKLREMPDDRVYGPSPCRRPPIMKRPRA